MVIVFSGGLLPAQEKYSFFQIRTDLLARLPAAEARQKILPPLFAGIRKNLKAFRLCGLTLFVICLVKIYCVDISILNTLGKVIAFILLGILFLGGAAAYIFSRKYFSREENP